jgi:2-alkyl-3-oxoalkanoate reductase
VKILVTGANGFLGRHVIATLLNRGHAIRALVRPTASVEQLGWPSAVEVAHADLRDGPLDALFPGVDVIVHLAAGGADTQFAATVVGTQRLLEAMGSSSVRRLVLASSFSVYDWSRIQGTLDEDSPFDPAPHLRERDGYAVAKSCQEQLTRAAAKEKGWELVVLRPGWIWGRGHGYLAGLGQRLGSLHFVVGPATRLPLTHVENCADLFALCVDAPAAAGRTFNVVDSDEVRVWQFLSDYMRRSGESGLRIPIPYGLGYAIARFASAASKLVLRDEQKLPGLLIPSRFEARFKPLRFSNAKARGELGWAPPFSYEACLDRTYGSVGANEDSRIERQL